MLMYTSDCIVYSQVLMIRISELQDVRLKEFCCIRLQNTGNMKGHGMM